MYLADLTWPAAAALDKNIPVVIPVAAVEQHGPHLPVYTDSLLLGEIVRMVEQELGDSALFTPLQWLGNSHHHIDYPGTLSASPRVYLDLLRDLAENFLAHGFKRLVFLNGHGGNVIPGRQAVYELRQKYRERNDLLLLFATYIDFSQPHEELPGLLVQNEMGHACEWETSMILHMNPQWVKGDLKRLQTEPLGFGFGKAYRGWITKDRTTTGHLGSPQHATAEKGEVLFFSFAAGVQQFLQKVAEWNGKSWQ